MKIYKEKVETSKRLAFHERVCDICGIHSSESSNWSKEDYGHDEIIVSRRMGHHYPGEGYDDVLDLDICPKCFEEKIEPFLKGLGVKIEYKNEMF